MSLYFAYGSNLSPGRLATRCPSARFVGTGRLDGFRLAFARLSKRWGGAVADLLPDRASKVWGSVFDLSDEDLHELDAYEGVPLAYYRKRIAVVGTDGRPVDAWCYFVSSKEPESLPSTRYWNAIVQGAVEVGLPGDYIAFLRACPHID